MGAHSEALARCFSPVSSMTSLFTPSKKRPRYSLPIHSAATADADGQLTNAFPHTLPRPTTNGRYASTAASTSTPAIHRSPFTSIADLSSPPAPTAPATPATPASSSSVSALSLLPSTSHFTPISSSSALLSPTPTTVAVHSLLSERSSRTTNSQLQLLSAQLAQQHEEQLTALRFQHNTERVEWKKEMADREKNLRVELAQLKWTAEERAREEEERKVKQREEDEERERRENAHQQRIDELQAKLTFVATAEQKRRTEHEQLQDERREEAARIAEERNRESRELRDMRTQLQLLKEKEGKWEARREDEVKLLQTELSVMKRKVKEKEDGEKRQSERVRELEAELKRREEDEKRREEDERLREQREAEIGGLQASLNARMEEAQEVDRRYRQVQEEVKGLKAQLTNQQLLEEQLRSLESKLRRIKADRDKLQQEAMEGDSLAQRQEAAMADISVVVGPVHSVEQVLVAVRTLNTTNRSLSQQLAALHEQVTQQTDELSTKHSQTTTLQQRIDTLEADLARANQRITTLSMERDSLNKLLKSYDDEDSRAGQHDNSHALRVSALEDTLGRERKEKERLTEEVRAVKLECGRVRKEKEQLEGEIETMRQRRQQASSGGEQDGEDVKVMHLADNPERQKRQEYVRGLEEQIKQLTERIAQLETNQPSTAATSITHSSTVPFTPSLSPIPHTATPHTTTTTSQPLSTTQLESLLAHKTAELSELQAITDKRYERLQSAFRDKAREFRDGVYQLCGWKMEQLRGGEWRLRSMYGEREGDVLLFVKDEQGMLRLQETELAVRLGKELLSVLTEWQSIPAFTASVTMELLSRSTRAR